MLLPSAYNTVITFIDKRTASFNYLISYNYLSSEMERNRIHLNMINQINIGSRQANITFFLILVVLNVTS
jgi:hypothetical protein